MTSEHFDDRHFLNAAIMDALLVRALVEDPNFAKLILDDFDHLLGRYLDPLKTHTESVANFRENVQSAERRAAAWRSSRQPTLRRRFLNWLRSG
jgi:hypothetical protein